MASSSNWAHSRALRIAVFAVVVASVVAIGLVRPRPASAYCGLNDEYGLTLVANSGSGTPTWGTEANYGDPQCGNSGTTYPYGLDGHYRGIIADTLTDGSCVYAHYVDGWPVVYDATQATSCSSGGTVYHFYDQDGTTYSLFRLEKYMGSTAWYWNNGY